MEQVTNLSKTMKTKLLNFLYKDEIFNIFLISLISNNLYNKLYIQEEQDNIIAVLHLKYDGNAYFTNFFAKESKNLKIISQQLQMLKLKNVLLAGKLEDVQKILNLLNIKKEIVPNIYYRLDETQFKKDKSLLRLLVKATHHDIPTFTPFLIDFFAAQTKAEIDDITHPNKIQEDLENGIYLYQIDGKIIGMGRFSGTSKNYCDITTIYIEPQYRKQGQGKQLTKAMIMKALEMNKQPVTQTAKNNLPARHSYESCGFVPIDDYAFEFIS